MKTITYRAGYRYQLARDYTVDIGLKGQNCLVVGFLKLEPDGKLTIRQGYAWDGPSGPTWDNKTFMRGSLVHDALYQFMREGQLRQEHRQFADALLRRHCREDGMNWFRAWYVYRSLRMFGGAASRASSKKPKILAP